MDGHKNTHISQCILKPRSEEREKKLNLKFKHMALNQLIRFSHWQYQHKADYVTEYSLDCATKVDYKTDCKNLRCKVYTDIQIHIVILWVMTSRSLVCGYQHLTGIQCLHLPKTVTTYMHLFISSMTTVAVTRTTKC